MSPPQPTHCQCHCFDAARCCCAATVATQTSTATATTTPRRHHCRAVEAQCEQYRAVPLPMSSSVSDCDHCTSTEPDRDRPATTPGDSQRRAVARALPSMAAAAALQTPGTRSTSRCTLRHRHPLMTQREVHHAPPSSPPSSTSSTPALPSLSPLSGLPASHRDHGTGSLAQRPVRYRDATHHCCRCRCRCMDQTMAPLLPPVRWDDSTRRPLAEHVRQITTASSERPWTRSALHW
jgi:hypothetical protein